MTLYANINHNTDLISVLKLYTVVMLKMDTDGAHAHETSPEEGGNITLVLQRTFTGKPT